MLAALPKARLPITATSLWTPFSGLGHRYDRRDRRLRRRQCRRRRLCRRRRGQVLQEASLKLLLQ
jgi:hypothetical protein